MAPGAPIPAPVVQTTRVRIAGLQDSVENLKSAIGQAPGLDGPMKAYLMDRLNGITASGARIDLHESDHPEGGGGFNLHITVRRADLGATKDTIFRRTG